MNFRHFCRKPYPEGLAGPNWDLWLVIEVGEMLHQRDAATEADLRDAATYGRCRCGQPFRQRIDRDDEGRPIALYAACDNGHDLGPDWYA